MLLRKYEGPKPLLGRFPTFWVENYIVKHRLNGIKAELVKGESVEYRRHGTFRVDAVLRNAAAIWVTLPGGKGGRLIVPNRSKVTIVYGCIYVQSLGEEPKRKLIMDVSLLDVIDKTGSVQLSELEPRYANMY
jgi:hypothetical protein